jgi:hypothetical protein
MEIQLAIDNLSKIEDAVRRGLQKAVVKAANDLASAVALRVVQSGETSKGGKFSNYSTDKVYASSFKGKGRSGGADSRITALGRGAKISYSEFRALNNLNTAPKNFEFTGDMWRNFGVMSIEENGLSVTANIGGLTEDAGKKIAGNSKREGIDIASASKKEEAETKADLAKWISEIINTNQ